MDTRRIDTQARVYHTNYLNNANPLAHYDVYQSFAIPSLPRPSERPQDVEKIQQQLLIAKNYNFRIAAFEAIDRSLVLVLMLVQGFPTNLAKAPPALIALFLGRAIADKNSREYGSFLSIAINLSVMPYLERPNYQTQMLALNQARLGALNQAVAIVSAMSLYRSISRNPESLHDSAHLLNNLLNFNSPDVLPINAHQKTVLHTALCLFKGGSAPLVSSAVLLQGAKRFIRLAADLEAAGLVEAERQALDTVEILRKACFG